MSIVVSIYDLFAYTIPGLIYLFALNEALRIMGLSTLRPLAIDFSKYWLPIILLAYLMGQLMQFLCSRLWIRLWYRIPAEERAYKAFKVIYPEKDVEFNPKQWPLLFAVIRREDHITAEMNDRNMAISIMLRNVSFGLFLFGLLNLFIAFRFVFSLLDLTGGVIFSLFSYIALRRADFYRILFFNIIYEQAIYYGKNLNEIVPAIRASKTIKPNRKS